MEIEKHKVASLLFIFLLCSCSASPPTGTNVNSPPPVIQINPLSQEKRIVGTDKVPQNNCNGTALLKQTLEKTRSIQYSLSAEAGLTVKADGSVGVPGIGDISVGASVAAKYGVEYGKAESLKRTIEYSAKEGSSVIHTINIVEILETGEFIVTAGSKTVKYPYKFLKDFGLEYVGAEQESCPAKAIGSGQVTTVPAIQTVVVKETVEVTRIADATAAPKGSQLISINETHRSWNANTDLIVESIEILPDNTMKWNLVFWNRDANNNMGVGFTYNQSYLIDEFGKKYLILTDSEGRSPDDPYSVDLPPNAKVHHSLVFPAPIGEAKTFLATLVNPCCYAPWKTFSVTIK